MVTPAGINTDQPGSERHFVSMKVPESSIGDPFGARIRQLAAAAPPLSDRQVARLRSLLTGPVEAVDGEGVVA